MLTRQHLTLACSELQLAKQQDSRADNYSLGEPHGGKGFCIWLLTFTSLVRETAS